MNPVDSPRSAEESRLRALLVRYIEVVQRQNKGRPIGVDPGHVRPGLYVVDWRAGRPEDIDSVKVEEVEAVEGDEVRMRGSVTDLQTFASIVLAGPFLDDSLEV